MPFDTSVLPTAPSLPLFIEILEQGIHHPLWPVGFNWDYRGCNTCAMGLAHRLWPNHFPSEKDIISDGEEGAFILARRIASVFDIIPKVAEEAFVKLGFRKGIPLHQILPHEVAEELKNG